MKPLCLIAGYIRDIGLYPLQIEINNIIFAYINYPVTSQHCTMGLFAHNSTATFCVTKIVKRKSISIKIDLTLEAFAECNQTECRVNISEIITSIKESRQRMQCMKELGIKMYIYIYVYIRARGY